MLGSKQSISWDTSLPSFWASMGEDSEGGESFLCILLKRLPVPRVLQRGEAGRAFLPDGRKPLLDDNLDSTLYHQLQDSGAGLASPRAGKKKKISVPSSAVFIESLFLSDSPVCLCCKRRRNPLHSSVSYTAPARSSPLLPSSAAGCGDVCAGV